MEGIWIYLFSYLFIYFSGVFSKNKNLICSMCIFIVMAFRYNVGWDYRWYFELAKEYSLMKESIFSNLNDLVYFDENLFQYLRLEIANKIIYKITWIAKWPQLLFIIYSFILVWFIKKGLENNNQNSKYPWIFFISFPLFFFSFLSLMRQSVAVGIIFYSYKYIKKRMLIKFIIVVFFAASFHKTALFMLPIYFLYNLSVPYSLIVMIMGSSFFSIKFLKIILKIPLFINYRHYVENSVGKGGTIVYFLIVLLSIFILVFYKKLKNDTYIMNIVLIGGYIYISLIDLGHLGPRMSQYFIIFILYLIDDFFLVFKNKKIIKMVYSLICLTFLMLILYGDFIQERRQFIPYKFNILGKENEWTEI